MGLRVPHAKEPGAGAPGVQAPSTGMADTALQRATTDVAAIGSEAAQSIAAATAPAPILQSAKCWSSGERREPSQHTSEHAAICRRAADGSGAT